MLQFEDLARFVVNRPAARLARRVAPDYPGHVSAVLPAQWLAPLTAAIDAEPDILLRDAESVLRAAGCVREATR